MKNLKIIKSIAITNKYVSISEEKDLRIDFEKKINLDKAPAYHQVFQEKHKFEENLSAIDILFNQGAFAKQFLIKT